MFGFRRISGTAVFWPSLETWLTDCNQDNNLFFDGFGAPFRLHRKAEVTGKTQGGRLCLYVNKQYCSSVTVREHICTPDVELLSVSLGVFTPEYFGEQ